MLSCDVHKKLDTFVVYSNSVLFFCFYFNKHLSKCVVNCVSSDCTTKCIESLAHTYVHTDTLFLHTHTQPVHVFRFHILIWFKLRFKCDSAWVRIAELSIVSLYYLSIVVAAHNLTFYVSLCSFLLWFIDNFIFMFCFCLLSFSLRLLSYVVPVLLAMVPKPYTHTQTYPHKHTHIIVRDHIANGFVNSNSEIDVNNVNNNQANEPQRKCVCVIVYR